MIEDKKVRQLEDKIDTLAKDFNQLQSQLISLRAELKSISTTPPAIREVAKAESVIEPPQVVLEPEAPAAIDIQAQAPPPLPKTVIASEQDFSAEEDKQYTAGSQGYDHQNIEGFIGRNLMSIIGVVVLLLGVVFGLSYLIDKNLISPTVRILLAYGLGLTLVLVAYKLRNKYQKFSAVLVSGGLAVFYFTSYWAFNEYEIINWWQCILAMLIISICTVYLSLRYNQQVIAIIGLVSAYAIPPLVMGLESENNNYLLYLGIINMGILWVSYSRYWKILYVLAFCSSWFILGAKVVLDTPCFSGDFIGGMIYTSVFFLMFYAMPVLFKSRKQKALTALDIGLMLANAAFFYFAVIVTLQSFDYDSKFNIVLFTLVNVIIHGLVSLWAHKQDIKDTKLRDLALTLSVSSLVIVVPFIFGNAWIATVWAILAAFMLVMGHFQKHKIFKLHAYIISLLAAYLGTHMFFDAQNFVSQLIFVGAFGLINWQYFKSDFETEYQLRDLLKFVYPAILIGAAYFMFYVQIDHYFTHNFYSNPNSDVTTLPHWVGELKAAMLLAYSLLFVSTLSLVNARFIKKLSLAKVAYLLTALVILVFMVKGLYSLSELREAYIEQLVGATPFYGIYLRYLCFVFLALAAYSMYYNQQKMKLSILPMELFRPAIAVLILWLLSSELLQILSLNGQSGQYGLSLSILWGVYAVLLISLGIMRKYKYIRYLGLLTFILILIKLFTYDVKDLSEGGRVIVYVSIGVLLLIGSFLYNKYKSIIK